MALLGSDFDAAVPANNSAVRLGASVLRDIKTRVKAFAQVMFDKETGYINNAQVTSAMLAAPTATVAAVTRAVTSGDAYVYSRFALNAQGQVIAATQGIITADITDAAITTAKLADASVTQAKILNNEVTSEKLARPRKFIRFDSIFLTNTTPTFTITRSLTVATVTCLSGAAVPTAHGFTVGDTVTISGATQTDYNGSFTITSIPSASTFTYTVANSPATPATGTPIVAAHICASSYTLSGNATTGTVSRVATTVTATMVAHGLAVGDRVRISGCSTAALNGEFLVATVADANTFTYTTTTSSTTGSLVASSQKLIRDFTVARTGVGAYTLTFATAMLDTQYCAVGGAGDQTSAARIVHFNTLTTASFAVRVRGDGGGVVEDSEVNVAVLS